MKTVRTRFAPSPTGMLHIGGARTALFNMLYARHTGGEYLGRIEDTDKERSTAAAIDAIRDGLDWLGLTPDRPWFIQSENEAMHRKAAYKMLEEGTAYRCYCTPEELEKMREEAIAQGRKPGYNRYWRDRTDGPEGKPFVIRIKMPLTGFTSWNDAVQGRIDYPNEELEDMVLLRADGTPVYNLAVVVDDAQMGITHVIRGDDHINNTPKQIALYNALGLPVPTFAHIPLIHGADGRKMSKRDGAASVLTYRDEGYLPDAVCNYLLRLGWSHKDEEIMTRDRAIELFDVHAINKGAAVFDRNKLDWLNAHYLREMPISTLIDALQPFFRKLDLAINPATRPHLEKGLPSLTKRAKRLTDLAEAAQFYLSAGAPALTAEAKAVLEGPGKENLRFAISLFTDDIAWDSHHLQERVKTAVAEKGLKIQDVAQPLRAALTGSTVSPSVFEIMEVLGRGESLSRLKSAAG